MISGVREERFCKMYSTTGLAILLLMALSDHSTTAVPTRNPILPVLPIEGIFSQLAQSISKERT